MAEQRKPQEKNVLTDKDKFQEKPEHEKVGHMGDKPGSAPEQERDKAKG
jgi:hypothetical protein